MTGSTSGERMPGGAKQKHSGPTAPAIWQHAGDASKRGPDRRVRRSRRGSAVLALPVILGAFATCAGLTIFVGGRDWLASAGTLFAPEAASPGSSGTPAGCTTLELDREYQRTTAEPCGTRADAGAPKTAHADLSISH